MDCTNRPWQGLKRIFSTSFIQGGQAGVRCTGNVDGIFRSRTGCHAVFLYYGAAPAFGRFVPRFRSTNRTGAFRIRKHTLCAEIAKMPIVVQQNKDFPSINTYHV